jgi:hypothetical protein
MIVISLLVAGGVIAVVVAFRIQSHDEHLLTAQMIRSESELRETGARIANIKDHQFKSMPDYVKAYAQVEPLLSEYDHELQEYSDLCNRAQRHDQTRWRIDSRRHRYNSETWRNASEIIELVRQINAVMKKEVSVVRDMSSFPEQEQVQFWHQEFVPLLAQEHALRERLLLVGERVSRQPRWQ